MSLNFDISVASLILLAISTATTAFALAEIPYFQRRRILTGLRNVSFNFEDFLNEQSAFWFRTVCAFAGIGLFSIGLLLISDNSFLLLVMVITLIVLSINLYILFYNWKASKFLVSISSLVTNYGVNQDTSETYGPPLTEIVGNTAYREDIKKFYQIVSSSISLFRGQFILWFYLLIVFFLYIYSLQYPSLYPHIALNDVISQFLLFLSIFVVLSSLIVIYIGRWIITYFKERLFPLFEQQDQNRLPERLFFVVTYGAMTTGTIKSIGKQLTITHLNEYDHSSSKRFTSVQTISLNWKDISRVECELILDTEKIQRWIIGRTKQNKKKK